MGNFLTKQPPKIHTVKLPNIALDLEHQQHHPPLPRNNFRIRACNCYLVINLIIQRRGYLIIIAKYHKQTK